MKEKTVYWTARGLTMWLSDYERSTVYWYRYVSNNGVGNEYYDNDKDNDIDCKRNENNKKTLNATEIDG